MLICPHPYKELQYCITPMQLFSPIIFHLTLTNTLCSMPFFLFPYCPWLIDPVGGINSLDLDSGIIGIWQHPDSATRILLSDQEAVLEKTWSEAGVKRTCVGSTSENGQKNTALGKRHRRQDLPTTPPTSHTGDLLACSKKWVLCSRFTEVDLVIGQ